MCHILGFIFGAFTRSTQLLLSSKLVEFVVDDPRVVDLSSPAIMQCTPSQWCSEPLLSVV